MIKSAAKRLRIFLVDFIRKVRYTVTIQSYAYYLMNICIQIKL